MFAVGPITERASFLDILEEKIIVPDELLNDEERGDILREDLQFLENCSEALRRATGAAKKREDEKSGKKGFLAATLQNTFFQIAVSYTHLDVYKRQAVQGWYPFGGRSHTAELLGDEVIVDIAGAHGVTAAQVILRWNLQRGVVVIPGSSDPDHIRENLDILDFSLTEEDMARIAALDRNEKHDWY